VPVMGDVSAKLENSQLSLPPSKLEQRSPEWLSTLQLRTTDNFVFSPTEIHFSHPCSWKMAWEYHHCQNKPGRSIWPWLLAGSHICL
jgi:hypothetical protein